jgi:hypothetical protein
MWRTSRKRAELSESLQRHLNSYALAASAAGMGVLALAQPADGKIIYTPAHHYVPLNGRLYIDLNHDGRPDFYVRRVSGTAITTSFFTHLSFTALDAGNAVRNLDNGMAGYPTYYGGAVFYDLPAGRQIDPSLKFPRKGFMANRLRNYTTKGAWHCGGLWNNARSRYLGARFGIEGKIHYGWVRLNEWCDQKAPKGDGARALLTGYAYETIPNKPIITGKTKGPDVITLAPGSLGALAAGASRLHSGK